MNTKPEAATGKGNAPRGYIVTFEQCGVLCTDTYASKSEAIERASELSLHGHVATIAKA